MKVPNNSHLRCETEMKKNLIYESLKTTILQGSKVKIYVNFFTSHNFVLILVVDCYEPQVILSCGRSEHVQSFVLVLDIDCYYPQVIFNPLLHDMNLVMDNLNYFFVCVGFESDCQIVYKTRNNLLDKKLQLTTT